MTDHAKSPLRRFLVLAAGMTLVAGALSSGVASGQAQAAAPGLPLSVPAVAPPCPTPGAPMAEKVKLNQSQLRLVKGKSITLEEAVYSTRATWPVPPVPEASYSGDAIWKSSNPKVATVNSKGKVTAKKRGSATITVTAKDYVGCGQGTVATSIKVTVVKSKPKAKVTKVTASVPKIMHVNEYQYVTGKYVSSKATGVKVKYSSTKAGVVSVDRAGRLVAKSTGTAKIKVTAGGKSKSYKVTVLPPLMDFNPGK